MDGTYGNVFPANSPMSSQTPSSSSGDAYKVNVSRQKTKKWANFKPQNYDGDDWGDYDDGHDEPPPPPKPMGQRQPVPVAPPPHLRQLHPPGSPPLHISTQQPAPGIGMGMAGRRQSETGSPLRSAPAGLDSAATGSSVYSAGPGYPHSGGSGSGSGTPLRRVSPAPQSAGPAAGAVPTRFPPRKSSMSQADAPDPTEFSQRSQSGSRPGSSHKLWVEPRAASPATSSAKSPISPTKPLPFIRPADIYRRMDEEKERERRSVESGRPSLDSITGRGLDRVDSAPKVVDSESADQRRPSSVGLGPGAGAEEDSELTKGSRPSLAPVAERKSEYGLEGLLDSYASDPRASIVPAPSSFSAAAQTLNTGATAANQAQVQTQVQAQTQAPQLASNLVFRPQAVEFQDELRRFSISPKLPDLGRLSAFGDDLFSNSPTFSSDAPSLARIQDSPPPHSPSEEAPHLAASDKTPPVNHEKALSSSRLEKSADPIINSPMQTSTQGSSAGSASSHPGKNAVLSESASTQEEVPPTATMDGDHSNPAEPNSAIPEQNGSSGASQLANVSSRADNGAPRPSLPGTWVTETPITPGEPPVLDPVETSRAVASGVAESDEGTPTMENDSVNQNASYFKDAVPPKQQPVNSQLGSPHALPPLRTGSPGSSASLQAAAGRPEPERDNSTNLCPANNPETPDFTGSVPNTATTANRDITPTAPLKPYRGNQESFTPEDPIVPSLSFDAGSTLDTTGSSPMKENDILREEIIKSLSPSQSTSSGLPNITGQSTSAYQSAAGPGRESSYLGDVYDDYWGAGEDRAEHQLDDTAPKESTSAAPAPDSEPRRDVASSPTTEVVSDSKPLRPRFSWEAGPGESIKPLSGTQVEQKSLSPELHSLVVAAAAPAHPVPTTTQQPAVPTALDADHLAPSASAPRSDTSPTSEKAPAASGGISHQISQASTIPPRSALDAPMEPPSPVSVLSERIGPVSEVRRLSLAEEKAGLQSSANEVSQTPPLVEHPAMVASGPAEQPLQLPSASASPQREVNILPFRQIMEMPTAAERIRYFRETRMQFATIDTGLDEWLAEMVKRHPEHLQPGFHFQPLAQSSAQAPHSQQQNPALPGELTEGGLPTHNIPMPPPPIHGSHNQVGTKSKELLLAAGKAGKGLLSKGKNKLRGTGDKEAEPLSPLAAAPIEQSASASVVVGQAGGSETPGPAKVSSSTLNKPKGNRRTSWGIGLGLRSSRSDLALALSQGAAAAPNLLSASSGSGSAQQASANGPLSTKGAQPQQSQLQASYHPDKVPRPQSGLGPGTGPLLQKTSVASPASTFTPPHQLSPVTRSSLPPGGQLSLSLLPSPGTSVHHTKDSSIDRFIVLDRHRDGQPELVSPVSDTFSNHPTPVPYERELGDNLGIPAPISKEQPSWDPFTGTPLVEEEDFDLEADDDSEYIIDPSAIGTSNQRGTGAARTTSAQAALNPPPDRAWAEEIPSQERQVDNVIFADNRNPLKDSDADGNATSNRDNLEKGQPQLPLVNKALDPSARPASSHSDQMATYAQNSNVPALPPASNFSQHPYNPHNAYLQHQGQNQNQAHSDPNAPQRQPSFVGLPPIRRESALGESLLKFPSDEGSVGGNNGDNTAFQQQQQHAQNQATSPQNLFPPQMATQAQFVTLPPGQQPQVVQHVYRPSQGQVPMQNQYPPHGGQGFPNPPPGAAHPQWTLRPQGQVQVQQRNFSGAPVNSPPSMMANGSVQQMNTGQGPQPMTQGSRPMVPPPHMAAAHQRFSPQGGWTVQESHLTEPLHSPNRHRSSPSNASSHQPVYGFDKETGVPSTSGLDQRDRDEDADQQPSGSGLPKQPQAAPSGQVSPASPPGKGVALPSPSSNEHQVPGQSDLLPPGPIPAADEGRARRNSGVFSSLREKFTGISPDDRQDQGSSSASAPRFQGVTGDEVSEASVVVTDDTSGQKKRGLFGGLRSSGHAFDNQAPRSMESIIAHGPGTPVGERMQPAPSPFPPPEKKKTSFFSIGGGSNSNSAPQSKLANAHTQRPSISSSGPPEALNLPAGSVGGPPKKRFSSAFKLHRSSPTPQDGLKPPGTAQSSVSTLQIQNQGQQQLQPPQSAPSQQPGSTAPPSLMGRDRSGSNATTRPVTASPPMSNPNQQFSSTAEQEKAKKSSGGIFGRFMNRDSKQATGPTSGQPVMNQGQMQLGRGQNPPGQAQFAPGQPQFVSGQPQFMPGPSPGPGQPQFQGQGQPQYYVQRIGPDGKPMMQLVQFVQHPGQPGQPGFPGYTGQPGQPVQPGQMVLQPQNMQMMGNGQQFIAAPQGLQQRPNGQAGPQPQVSGPSGPPSQIQLQDNQTGRQFASSVGVQQPPTPQQVSQANLGPGTEQGNPNSNSAVQPGASSPQVSSAVSQRSQFLASPPGEQSRSQSSSPVNVRQPVPVPPPGSMQAMQTQAPRPQPSTPTPPNQAFTRKPVQSSPKPPADQLGPPPLSDRTTQHGHRSGSISSQIQPPTGLQSSPSPGVILVDQSRGSSTPIPQPLPGTQAQIQPQRPPLQQSPQGSPGNHVPQPVPVPLPTPIPQPSVHGSQNMLHPPVQQSPLRPAANNQQRPETTPSQGQGQGQPAMQPVARIPSHGSAAGPGPANQPPQASGAAVAPPREQSTFSKLLKGAMPAPAGQGQDKPAKEKSKSSFMSAFKSRTKQSEGPSQPQQIQASQAMQQGAGTGAAQIQQGQPQPSMQQSPQPQPQRIGPQGQGQAGPQHQYQHQRQSPSISRSPDNGSAAQNTSPQQTISPGQASAQPPQPQASQVQQPPTGLRQPGQQMPPPAAGRGGPQGAGPPQNQSRGPAEPQYAQVPIPRGYGYVHAEGGVAPAPTPYFVGVQGVPGGQQQQQQQQPQQQYRPSPGQFGPQGPGTMTPQQQQQQQAWARQNALERQIQPVPLPGQQFVAQRPEGSPAPLSQQSAPQPGGPQLQNAPSRPHDQQSNQVGVARQQVAGQPTANQQSFSQAANSQSAENSPHPSGLTPTPIGTPGGLSPVSASPPLQAQSQFQPRSEPSGPVSVVTSVSPPSQVQVQYASSPQNYPLPNTTFSPVNPAAAGVPNPPLPQGQGQGVNPGPYGMLQNNTGLVPQRQVSAVSQISMQPDASPPRGQNMASPVSHALSGQSANESPSPQFTPDRAVSPELHMRGLPLNNTIDSRTVSPEPPAQSLAPPPAVTTPRATSNTGNQVEEDNIYDATPRHSFMPRNQQVQNSIASQVIAAPSNTEATEPKPPGPSHQVVAPVAQAPQQQQHIVVETQPQQPPIPQPVSEPPSPVMPPAIIAEPSSSANGNGNAPGNPQVNGGGKPVTSSADIFNEEKRKMLIREQEEKIPVFPTEPDMNLAAAAAAKKKEQEEMPHMTATSYPGQEWNPYGDGGYEEWD